MTQIIVDCPICGAPNTIDTVYDEHIEGPAQIAAMFGVQAYSFSGGGRCAECNNVIMTTLTVSGGQKDEDQ